MAEVKSIQKKLKLLFLLTLLICFSVNLISAQKQSSLKKTNESQVAYKRIGQNLFGYFNVPKTFVEFREADLNSQLMQYSKPDQRIILSVMGYGKTNWTLEKLTNYFLENASKSNASSISHKRIFINNMTGILINSRYSAFDKELDTYIIDEGKFYKYIAIEYTPENKKTASSIIKSYNLNK